MIKHTLLVLMVLLLIPSCSSNHHPAPVKTLNTKVNKVDYFAQQSAHTVQAGETLYGIAWLYNIDYQTLAQVNNLREPYTLAIGDKLYFAKKSKLLGTKKDNYDRVNTQTVKSPVVKRNSTPKVKKTPARPLQQLPNKVSQWVWPTEGKLITRFSNQNGGSRGIEISNKRGSKVVAAAPGKVVYVGSALRGYGKLIIIKHTNNFLSAYAHNDQILVNEQQMVAANQQIATMGSSGTKQVKLRFEIRYKGKSQDPLRYLP